MYPRLVLASVACLLIAACGGGGGSGGGSDPDHPLTGTWFGTFDILTTAAGYGTLTITFGSDGKATDFKVDGSELDITAEEVGKESGFYTYETDGGVQFFVRKTGDNLAYASPGDEVALLERGTDSRPSYDLTDITGSYSGTEYVVDAFYNLQSATDGTGEITGDSAPLTFTSGSSETGCESEGKLNLASSTDGVYTGTFQNVSGTNCLQSGSVKAYLSPDQDTVLLVACESFEDFDVPQDCGFSLGSRQ